MRSLLLSLQCNKRTPPTMVRLFPSGVINIREHRKRAAIVRQAVLQLGLFIIIVVYVLFLSRFLIRLYF